MAMGALDPLGQSRKLQSGATPSSLRCCVTLKQRHRLRELAGLRETGDLAHVDLRERVHDCAFLTGVEYRRDAWRTDGLLRCSGGAVCQRRLHGRAGLESAEDLHGCDGGAGEFRRDIAGDASEAENLDVKRCPGIAGRLEILPRIVRQPELELSAR